MTLIARLSILLNDVDPQPMRHIEVPLKIRLDRLHEVIRAAMGRTDTHLYEFRAGDAGWGVPDPDGFYDGPMPAKKATLQKCSRTPAPGRSTIASTSVMTGITASGSRRSTRPSRV
ncbi:plasmid pRiA4b ORF-3 family protein [Paracoccus sp. PAR01]|uniref:plasmid pRiA4b ORF-3 family protein n=1 Tax=Paracoccus sp. PAR01 TaxID=2769282 RepID=UPI00210410FA|nr:plasmid pRiA4b ORF-3 family protein [Paracoccus sp. PAR01]